MPYFLCRKIMGKIYQTLCGGLPVHKYGDVNG